MRAYYAILLLLVASCSTATQQGTLNFEQLPVMGNASSIIPPLEMPELENNALKGDGNAAMRLYNYYNEIKPEEMNKGDYWLTIAAEDGNMGAMRWVGYLMVGQPDPRYKLRGCFWLDKLMKIGHGDVMDMWNEYHCEKLLYSN